MRGVPTRGGLEAAFPARSRSRGSQRSAGFDRFHNFRSLRHSSVTALYRMTRGLFLARRLAMHASPLTTVVYTHPSDEEMYSRVRDLRC